MMTMSGCSFSGGGAILISTGARAEDPVEMLLAGVVLLDVDLTYEGHVADVAPHVHLAGGVGHFVPVLPSLLVLLQVGRRHAPHAADDARHGWLLECWRLGAGAGETCRRSGCSPLCPFAMRRRSWRWWWWILYRWRRSRFIHAVRSAACPDLNLSALDSLC